MLAIFYVVAPVFALVATGYLAVRFKLYPSGGVGGLITFVNNFATPCLLFRAMMAVDFSETFNPRIILSFFSAGLICFALGIFLSRLLFENRPGTSVAAGVAGMFSNTVMLGIPIIQRAYGQDALLVIYTIIGLHAPILLSTAIVTMEVARRDGGHILATVKLAAWRVVSNPLLVGIILGLIVNFSGLSLLEPIDAFTQMMAAAVVPAALFGLGGALNDYSVRDNWIQPSVLTGIKLFLQPAIAWLVLVPILGVEHDIARFAVVLAGMPSGINVYIFATSYKRAEDIAANTVLFSTGLSILSISFWLYVMTL